MRFTPQIEALAEHFHLELRKGRESFELSQSLILLTQADRAGAQALEKTQQLESNLKAMNTVIGLIESAGLGVELSAQAATGVVEGYRLSVAPSSGDHPSLQLAVMFPTSLHQKLHIFKEGLGSRLGKIFFRLQDVQLGDPELDPLVMIKSESEPATQATLSRPEVRQALLDLFREPGEAVINDISARILVSSGSDQYLISLTQKLFRVAKTLAPASP